MRIVSLLPAATDIVCALGLEASLVGCSHECDEPAAIQALPALTHPRVDAAAASAAIHRQVESALSAGQSLYDIDADTLLKLRPDIILTQAQCDVCAVSEADVLAVARRMSPAPAVITLKAQDLRGILADIRAIAKSLGRLEKAAQYLNDMAADWSAIRAAVRTQARPTVACLEWLEPCMIAGNWTPELIDMAGGSALFAKAGLHSSWLAWETLTASRPEVIVIAPCGFDLARTRREAQWLPTWPGWAELPAVRNQRVYVVDGNRYMNRPGPRVLESARLLAEILHPAVVPAALRGRAWDMFISQGDSLSYHPAP